MEELKSQSLVAKSAAAISAAIRIFTGEVRGKNTATQQNPVQAIYCTGKIK